jgi:hypothetical protein
VSEIDHLGFNLYRSVSEAGPWLRLNDALIASPAPGSTNGAVYQWLDSRGTPGETRWYCLEAVDLRAGTRTVGLTSVQVPATPGQVYLPLIR